MLYCIVLYCIVLYCSVHTLPVTQGTVLRHHFDIPLAGCWRLMSARSYRELCRIASRIPKSPYSQSDSDEFPTLVLDVQLLGCAWSCLLVMRIWTRRKPACCCSLTCLHFWSIIGTSLVASFYSWCLWLFLFTVGLLGLRPFVTKLDYMTTPGTPYTALLRLPTSFFENNFIGCAISMNYITGI